ncbi:MAG: hypothetical protein Tsb0021_03170 [Chlamydiales bacterium]
MRSVSALSFVILFAILFLDTLTKAFVVQWIPEASSYAIWYPYNGIGMIKDFFGIQFSIVNIANTGAAWGSFPEYQEQLLYTRIGLIIGMFGYLYFYLKNPLGEIPLMMVIAGAIGNVIDTFLYGHVIDMLYFVFWGYHFPAFNVADSAICIGIFWLLFTSWRIVPATRRAKSKA